ncbi:MAG TPA: hypothetical protein VHL80_02255, partial [Polyangia bacterium]|nr:hypothetical protein [Polyangia bacterium]
VAASAPSPPPPPVAAPAPAPAPEPTKVAAAEPSAASPRGEQEDEQPAQREEPTEAQEAPSKAHKPTIMVTFRSDPEGAQVATKSHVYGTTPWPTKLAPGTKLELSFTKAGYASATKKYVVPSKAKGPQTLRVSLKKLPDPKKSPPAAPAAPSPKKGWFSR